MKLKLIAVCAAFLVSCAHEMEDGTMSYLHAPASWDVSGNPLDFPGDGEAYTDEYIRAETERLHAQNMKRMWYPYSDF